MDFKKFQEAWCKHQIDVMLSFYTDDCVFNDMPTGEVIKGKEALKEFFKFTFDLVPDFAMKIDKVHEGQGFAVTQWRLCGTPVDHPTVKLKNAYVEQKVASILELKDDKIKMHSDYWDISPLLVNN